MHVTLCRKPVEAGKEGGEGERGRRGVGWGGLQDGAACMQIVAEGAYKTALMRGKPAARCSGVLQASSRLSTEIPALMRVSRTCVCPKAAA